MDQDGKIECWQAEYVYTDIQVAHLLFWSFESSDCHQVAQVAFQAPVAPVMVEVHLCLCTPSESVNSLLCHFDKDDSRPFDFHEPLPGVFPSQGSLCYARETQHPASFLFGLWQEVP